MHFGTMDLSPHEIEQIEALLTGQAHQFAGQFTPADPKAGVDYKQAFTVRRPQIEAYIAAHGLPPTVLKPGGDGPWLWPPDQEGASAFGAGSGKQWLIFKTEGGRTEELGRYSSYHAAAQACLDYLLKASGTGLNF